MTINLKVSVNGNYVATVRHSINGEAQPAIVVKGATDGSGPVEKSIDFRHGAENTYAITEQTAAEFEKDSGGEMTSSGGPGETESSD